MNIKKICQYTIAAITLLVISVFTPIFASTLGKILEYMGDFYDKSVSSNLQYSDTKTVYVLLGGGLKKQKYGTNVHINLNEYSILRTKTLWQAWQTAPHPILISGAEAPWMQDFLHTLNRTQPTNIDIISDNASLNTCENTVFSTKLLRRQYPNSNITVILVSDWYHMARVRRGFARLGIKTTVQPAPLPAPMSWRYPKNNLMHSRRALYESLALLRDIIQPQNNCRKAHEVSFSTLNTPRRQAEVENFSFAQK